MYIGIDLPTDDLLQVIISKSFSDRQININPKKTKSKYLTAGNTVKNYYIIELNQTQTIQKNNIEI